MHFFAAVAALLTVSSTLVVVQGTPVPGDDNYHPSHDKQQKHCRPNEFYYRERHCCLPRGGPVKHYPVHKAKHCPHDFYWHPKKECCVPKYERHAKPWCPDGLVWKENYCQKPYLQHTMKRGDPEGDFEDSKDGKESDETYDDKEGDDNDGDNKNDDDEDRDSKDDDKNGDKEREWDGGDN